MQSTFYALVIVLPMIFYVNIANVNQPRIKLREDYLGMHFCLQFFNDS